MENEEKLNVATKTKLATVEEKITSTLSSNNKVTKVLTLNAKQMINKINVESGQVKFEGEVVFSLLVSVESGEILPLEQKAEFSKVVESEKINSSSIAIVEGVVEDVSSAFEGDDLKLSCSCVFDVYVINALADVSCAKRPESVLTKEDDVSFVSFVGNEEHKFNVNLELAKDKISKVLSVSAMPYIKTILSSNDYFVTTGEVYFSVVYETSDGEVKSTNKREDFSQEVECGGVTKDSIIQANVFAGKENIIEGENSYAIEVPLTINAQVFANTTTSCIVDAYSLDNEIELTTASYTYSEFLQTVTSEENIITNFKLSENFAQIDKILAVSPIGIIKTKQIVKDGEILVEGIASINIIYYTEDDDGNRVLSSVDVSVPYSTTFSVAELKSQDEACVYLSFGDINVKNRHGRDLEMLIELKANINIFRSKNGAITTDIMIGEEKLPSENALEVYVVREGEDLWDVSKKLNISSTDFILQNRDISLPLHAGDKVIAYHRLKEEQ